MYAPRSNESPPYLLRLVLTFRMSNLFEQHTNMRKEGLAFVETIKELLQRLLEYRSIITDESKENRMSCTVNLLVSMLGYFYSVW